MATAALTAGEVLALDHVGARRAGAANGPGGRRGRGEDGSEEQHTILIVLAPCTV